MANILTIPESGIFFDGSAEGSNIAPILTGDASGVAIQYDGYAGVEINSSATGVNYLDRFSVEGANGRLFGVTDEVTGTVFSVNDAAGLPIIEVESTSTTDTITMGTYNSNALVVAGDSVGVGINNPSYPLEVAGAGTVSIAYQRTGVTGPKKWGFHSDSSNTYWHNITDNVLAMTLSNAGDLIAARDLTARVGSFKSIDASASVLMNLMCNDGNNAASFRTTVSGRVFEIRSQNSGTLKFDSTSSTFTGTVTATHFYGDGSNLTNLPSGADNTKLPLAGGTMTGTLTFDGSSSADSSIDQSSGYLQLIGNAGSTATGARMCIGAGTTDAGFYVNAAQHFFRDQSSNTRLYVAGGGNVGIVTTSPFSKLTVSKAGINEGTISFDDQANNAHLTLAGSDSLVRLQMGTYNNGSYGVWIQGSYDNGGTNYGTEPIILNPQGGRVGIGTTSPTTALTIRKAISSAAYGAQASMIEFKSYFTGYDTETVKSAIYSGVSDTGTLDTKGGYMSFHVNNNGTMGEKLRIDKSGSVGIGTTSPEAHVHIYSGDSNQTATNVQGLFLENNGSSNSYYAFQIATAVGKSFSITNAGNVGIGTTSPSEKLDVNGIASTSYYFKYKGHSLNMSYGQGGSDSVLFDYTHYSDNAFLSTAADVENLNTTDSSEWVASSDHPFAGGKVLQTSGYRFFYSDYIPVTPGEELYGEIYTKYISGSGGVLYYGIERFDSEKNPIGGNTGTTYFVSSNFNATSTSWTKKSGYTTLPTTHTAYNGSNGGGCYYVRIRILFNYPSGSAVRQFGGIMLKRTGVAHDQLISGEVGIGTTTLTNSSGYSTLSISGTTGGQIAFQTAGTGKHYLYSSALDFNIYNSQTGNIRLYTNASEKMRITSSGEVGIGVTSPNSALHINGSFDMRGNTNSENDTNQIYLNANNGNSGGTSNDLGPGITWAPYYNTYSKRSAGILQIGEGNYFRSGLAFFTNDTANSSTDWSERMRISMDGNVGIGTTSPQDKLDVAGIVNSSNTIVSNATYTMFSGRSNRTTNDYGGLNKQYFKLNLVTAGPNTTGESSAHGFADLRFQLANSSGTTSVADIMTLRSSGNVGIGTTIPARKLHVSTGNTYVAARFENTTSNGNVIEVKTSGDNKILNIQTDHIYSNMALHLGIDSYNTYIRGAKVGIGTTDPDAKLEVAGGSTGILLSNAGDSSAYDAVAMTYNGYNSGTPEFIFQPKTNPGSGIVNSFFRFKSRTSGGSNVANVTVSGKIGIGAVAPNAKLHIADSGSDVKLLIDRTDARTYSIYTNSSSDLRIKDEDASADRITITSSGKVGIGTTASLNGLLNVGSPSATNVKVSRIAGDTTTVYQYGSSEDATLEWTCGSYFNSEVVITASQTNGGTYNNLYIRGIWSNNHTSHHWDELEHVGSLTGTTFTITNGQNGSTAASGRLTLGVDYVNGSFATLNIRITDFFGTHAYTIT